MKKKKPKGIDAPTLNYIVSGLLVLTAILHLGSGALLPAESEFRLPFLGFGAAFLAAGVWTRKGGRPSIVGAMLLCAVGLAAGGSKLVAGPAPMTLPLMLLIDVAVIAAGAAWLAMSGKKRA